jgi:hypothetical protein
MPSRKRPDGTFQDIAHPISNEVRRYLEDVVLTAYWEVTGGDGAPVTAPVPPKPGPLVGRVVREWPAVGDSRGPMVAQSYWPF